MHRSPLETVEPVPGLRCSYCHRPQDDDYDDDFYVYFPDQVARSLQPSVTTEYILLGLQQAVVCDVVISEIVYL